MTLQDLKERWHDEITNWDVKNLWAEDWFMADSFNYPDFAAYVLRVRPELRRDKGFKINFLGLGHSKVAVEPESPQIEREPVEEIPKAVQNYRDVVKYSEDNGFI